MSLFSKTKKDSDSKTVEGKNPKYDLLYDWLYIYYAIVVLVIYSILSVPQTRNETLIFCGLILIWLYIDVNKREKTMNERNDWLLLREEILSLKQLIRKSTGATASPEEDYEEMLIENGIKKYKDEQAYRDKKINIDIIYLLCAYGLTLFPLFYYVWPVVFGPWSSSFIHAVFH